MFADQAVAGSWPELVVRLDRAGAPGVWAAVEPALAGFASVADLVAVTAPGADAARADAVLGGLVRTAAVGGGDVCDAVLVVVHLLSPGLCALARDLADLSEAALDLVVAEACLRVRGFPVDRRRRAFAANILLDTRKALMAELLPGRRERPADPAVAAGWIPSAPAAGGPGLGEVLAWATAAGVLAEADAQVVGFVTAHGRVGPGGCRAAAARFGCSVRTVGRRRAAAVAALRAAAPQIVEEIF